MQLFTPYENLPELQLSLRKVCPVIPILHLPAWLFSGPSS